MYVASYHTSKGMKEKGYIFVCTIDTEEIIEKDAYEPSTASCLYDGGFGR